MKIRALTGAMMLGAACAGANAADLPVKARPAPMMASSSYNWTGCYIGVEGGGNWGRSQHFNNDPASPNFGLAQTNGIDLSGAMVGGTVGCNYQFAGSWVIGAEADWSWTNKSGSLNFAPPFNTTETVSTSESWIGTARGRLGYAFDHLLVYGTGGAAFTKETFQIVDPVTGVGGNSANITGWTVGGGIEYAFWNNLSLKLEYLHVDFGRTSYPFAPNSTGLGAGGFAARQVRLSDDIVRAGLNYKFDWGGPVVARY